MDHLQYYTFFFNFESNRFREIFHLNNFGVDFKCLGYNVILPAVNDINTFYLQSHYLYP